MRLPRLKFVLFVAGLAILAAGQFAAAETVDAQKATASDDGKIFWYDCKDIGVEGKGWTDTESFYDRLPAKAEGTVSKKDWGLSHDSTGMCVRFTTDASSFQVRWALRNKDLAMPHMPATGVSGVDLYAKDKAGKWRFVANGRPTAVTNTATFKPPASEEFLLYLPLYNGVKTVEIGIAKDRTISMPDAAAVKQRKTVVVYGTSITQGGCASRPGMAFLAIVGRRLDATIINLGFSGSGRMESELADLLAELNPSIYVLDTMGNMSGPEVSERAEPFIKKLRQSHCDTPILLVEDANLANRRTEKGDILRALCEKLSAQGDKNVYFLSNRGMLGEDGEGTVDGDHPNDLGMMRHADAFTEGLRPLLQTTN
jgi:lysophospholipase L1-like esterase